MQQSVSLQEYYRQCELAAIASRLHPYALDAREKTLISGWTSDKHRDEYLSIRNGILRLWHRNPLVIVTREECISIVRHNGHHDLVFVAHEWLARNGYINFGCLDIPTPRSYQLADGPKRRTIVVIGAGVSGLACARQLQGLCAQFRERWNTKPRQPLPRVVVLEGRNRIGGRVYSHPLSTQTTSQLPHALSNTAEMGAQIITGFESGNPLDAIIRGQLALEHHFLTPDMVLYDHDGSIIQDEKRDKEMDKLFNSVLELASKHSWKQLQMSQKAAEAQVCAKVDCLGQEVKVNGSNGKTKTTQLPHTLGAMMDGLVSEYQKAANLTPLDFRLLNWHYANLEYANAANLSQLSLGGWDQDGGNEFEGRHSQVIGGYSQVPRALKDLPTSLDVRLGKAVSSINYRTKMRPSDSPVATIDCEDGDYFEADYVVLTAPLGVLQEGSITFSPALPDWKLGAIHRLGFGLLNKVILVFDHVFWERERDMFGLLNQAQDGDSLRQKDYSLHRGKAYLFWNCVRTSGRPMLVALMAGDAAYTTEITPNVTLIEDVTTKLQKIFKLGQRPTPLEAIVTRWKKDRFARGSYSYIGPSALPGDYDAMAKPIENLFFAGEATCQTHPATVHGAYLSGLRAASQVFDALAGPIPTTKPVRVRSGAVVITNDE